MKLDLFVAVWNDEDDRKGYEKSEKRTRNLVIFSKGG